MNPCYFGLFFISLESLKKWGSTAYNYTKQVTMQLSGISDRKEVTTITIEKLNNNSLINEP